MWIESANNHIYNAGFMVEIYVQEKDSTYAVVGKVMNCPELVVLSDRYEEEERLQEIFDEFRDAAKINVPYFTFDIL